MNNIKLRFIAIAALFLLTACKRDDLLSPYNTVVFSDALSAYSIYTDDMSDLVPQSDVIIYELGSSLFTDFAYKQRLIKIPEGTEIKKVDNGLPNYPNGTIIVKTFYYLNDERDSTQGKRIIETRLLVKNNETWSVADYLWNDSQTDAFLIESGYDTPVNFINQNGEAKTVAYHVPNNRECATCHNVAGGIFPIGPTVRNLNIPIMVDGSVTNQLEHFQTLGKFEPFDLSGVTTLPNYHDTSLELSQRARGYLYINCAHCHFDQGYAAGTELYLDYKTTEDPAKISAFKFEIKDHMQTGFMPGLGVSVIDEEGVSLIVDYLNGL